MRRIFHDVDGDPLRTWLWTEPEGFWMNGTMAGGLREPDLLGEPSEQWILRPGNYTIHLAVSDGHTTIERSQRVIVHGAAGRDVVTVFVADEAVDDACPFCSHDAVLQAPGAQACTAFHTRARGTDCLWHELDPAWTGLSYFANATAEANVDLEFRTSCATAGESLEVSTHQGHEHGQVPDGGHCVVLWARDSPATLQFEIRPKEW